MKSEWDKPYALSLSPAEWRNIFRILRQEEKPIQKITFELICHRIVYGMRLPDEMRRGWRR